jgi:hypothetical protein
MDCAKNSRLEKLKWFIPRIRAGVGTGKSL